MSHTLLIVLEQERPIARVERRRGSLGLDGILVLGALCDRHVGCMRLLYYMERISATWVLWNATEMRRTAEKTRWVAKGFSSKALRSRREAPKIFLALAEICLWLE